MNIKSRISYILFLSLAFVFGVISTQLVHAVLAEGKLGAVISGCITSTGVLHVITTGSCKVNQTPVQWTALQTPGSGQFVGNATLVQIAQLDGRLRDWSGDNFSGQDLSAFQFGYANLTSANLSGANLGSINFDHAILTNANFSNAMIGTVGTATFTSASASGITVTGSTIGLLKAEGANFGNVNFSNVTFQGGIGVGQDFIGANLTGASFSGVASAGQFSSANLTNANFSNAVRLRGAWIFDGANLMNTNLTNLNMTNGILAGATNFATANVTGVTWSNTACPDGTNSNDDGNTCVGH